VSEEVELRRQGFTFLQAFALTALAVIAAFLVLPVFIRITEVAENKHRSCQTNQRQIGLGFLQYIQDWDDRFALVNVKDAVISEKNPLRWADALQPYLKSTRIFHCPDLHDSRERKPNELGYTDYFYNNKLSAFPAKKLSSPMSTILTGDGNDGTDATNARYSLSTLPAAWRADKNSPAYRHLGGQGANYAFADGHVKWLQPKKVADAEPTGSNYTFAVR
jgi:prepilin-type processing-associated H-X9-DG protein